MGNDESKMVDDSVSPDTLKSRDLKGLADYLKSDRVQRVVVMTGAGISTSAGIPDFRSPDTGLYANLARLNLPYAEAVFDISYFRRNPEPFYTLAHELYPGRFRPTIAHSFIRLLQDKGLLLKHFTQNIDCLDREAGVTGDKIVEAHGSFARQSCIDCRDEFPEKDMQDFIRRKDVPRCSKCGGLVKPEIVFFGEALPAEFFAARSLPTKADLVIVMGTSLTVQPFASLPNIVPDHVPRVLINLERVGGLGSRPDDVLLLGNCDNGVRRLAKACGWLDELEGLWAETAPKAALEMMDKTEQTAEDEIEKLTRDIDKTLQLNKEHIDRLQSDPALKEKITAHVVDSSPSENAPLRAQVSEKAAQDMKDKEARQDGNGLDHVFPHVKKDSSL